MWRKSFLHLLHQSKICGNICIKTHPWGWKKLYNLKFPPYKAMSVNNLNEDQFKIDTIEPYNIIYKTYLDKKDFLDFQFTSPSLSLALNKLRDQLNEKTINKLPKFIDVKEVNILSNNIKYEFFTCNMKYLGYYNKKEIYDELTAGFIGPEIQHLWDKKPEKQVITVSYKSKDYYDIIEWERDLSLEDPLWQVSNINYII